jgi:hypothetical protein
VIGIGDVFDQNIWAYRATEEVPIQDVTIAGAAGHGALRFRIKNEHVKSFRKTSSAMAHLGELVIRSENVGSLQSIVGIDRLDENGAVLIEPVPEGLYRVTFKSSLAFFFRPGADLDYKWMVEIVNGKTTELECNAEDTGAIAWSVTDNDAGGQYLIHLRETNKERAASGSWSSDKPKGVIPLLPKGTYLLQLVWRAERTNAHQWTELAAIDATVEGNQVTNVVFPR